jgi:hypothetical protein
MRYGLWWCLAVSSWALAQDVSSGPTKDKAVPALKVFVATGTHMGKEVDLVAERKDKPTIYVVVHAEKWDRPMARFLRKLDETVQQAGNDAAIVAVWIGGDFDKTKEYLPKAQMSLQLQATTLTARKDEPAEWNINSDAHLTAVVVRAGRVTALFGYRSLNETDAPAVAKALSKK